jgi:hypothetical protein
MHGPDNLQVPNWLGLCEHIELFNNHGRHFAWVICWGGVYCFQHFSVICKKAREERDEKIVTAKNLKRNDNQKVNILNYIRFCSPPLLRLSFTDNTFWCFVEAPRSGARKNFSIYWKLRRSAEGKKRRNEHKKMLNVEIELWNKKLWSDVGCSGCVRRWCHEVIKARRRSVECRVDGFDWQSWRGLAANGILWTIFL